MCPFCDGSKCKHLTGTCGGGGGGGGGGDGGGFLLACEDQGRIIPFNSKSGDWATEEDFVLRQTSFDVTRSLN